jgi:hypothetical protein
MEKQWNYGGKMFFEANSNSSKIAILKIAFRSGKMIYAGIIGAKQ